jgi:hypothetical protein
MWNEFGLLPLPHFFLLMIRAACCADELTGPFGNRLNPPAALPFAAAGAAAAVVAAVDAGVVMASTLRFDMINQADNENDCRVKF